MKKMMKKISLLSLSLAALGCMTVGATVANVASASDPLPAVEAFNPATSMTMLSGANLKKDANMPRLKFTAEISDYNSAYNYGMLIIPAAWLDTYTFDNNYIDVLNAEVGENAYKNVICEAYQDVEEFGTVENPGEWRISATINEADDYSVEYIAIAYVTDGSGYKYASYDVTNNARSFMYVAQMALKHDANLTEDEVATLEKYVNYEGADAIIHSSAYLVYDAKTNSYDETQFTLGGSASIETGEDKVLSLNINKLGFDPGELSIVTKEYYFDVTEISYNVKVDAKQDEAHGGNYAWWGVNYFESKKTADLYTNMVTASDAQKVNNDWQRVTFTFAEPISGYISIIGAVGEFEDPTMLVDDFKIVSEGKTYTDDFNNATLSKDDNGLFENIDKRTDVTPVSIVSETEAGVVLPALPVVSSMTISTGEELITPMETKKAYSNITSIEYDVCMSENVTSGWGGLQLGDATGESWNVNRVYEHLNGENVNFFGGYIDYTTKLNKGETYHAVVTVDGTSISASFTSKSGDQKTASGTLTETTGLYVAFYHECKNGGNYTISNFKITADGKTEYGAGLFNGGESVTMSETVDTSSDFNNVLNAGVADYFAQNAYASIKGAAIDDSGFEDLPANAVAMTTAIEYLVTGEKAFGIQIGGRTSAPEYLYVNGDSISFYKNTVKVGESIALTQVNNKIIVSITQANEVFLSINDGDFVYIGKVNTISALKVVPFGGTGSVALNQINSWVYTAESKGPAAQTLAYATYEEGGAYEGLTLSGATAAYEPSDVVLSSNLSMSVANREKTPWVTEKTYEFTSLSFDIYMPALAGKTSWLGGFAFRNEVLDVYDTKVYGKYPSLVRNSWNHVDIVVNGTTATMTVNGVQETLNVPAGANYFYMTFNPGDGEFNAGDILKLNNFTITDANGTYTDTFDNGESTLLTSEYALADFTFEKINSKLQLTSENHPSMLGVYGSAIGGHEVIAVQLKETYSNVTEMTFSARYDNTVVDGLNADRWGLGISTQHGKYSSYYSPASFEFPQDNQWHEYKFTFSADGMSMYLDGNARGVIKEYKGIALNDTSTYQFYLLVAPKQDIGVDEILVYMDNFSITANGTTYTDDFSNGANGGLFDHGTGKRALETIYVEGNNNSIDNVASVINDLDSYIAGAAFEMENLKDNKKILNGTISYKVEGGKEFAILLGEDAATNSADFLYVTATSITFCKVVNGELTKVETIAASANNILDLTMLKSGELRISNGVEMVVVGNVSNPTQMKLVDVNGKGCVTFTQISLTTQKCI